MLFTASHLMQQFPAEAHHLLPVLLVIDYEACATPSSPLAIISSALDRHPALHPGLSRPTSLKAEMAFIAGGTRRLLVICLAGGL